MSITYRGYLIIVKYEDNNEDGFGWFAYVFFPRKNHWEKQHRTPFSEKFRSLAIFSAKDWVNEISILASIPENRVGVGAKKPQ